MTCEDTYFIKILSDFLNEKKSVLQADIDWIKLLKLAKNHQVDGILFYQCKSFLPARIAKNLEERFASTLFYYKNREVLIDRIGESFTVNNIPFFWIKGMNVAQFYPQPALRTMGDCDLVIHPEDRDAAETILSGMGLSKKIAFTGKERGFTINHMNIELHHRLVYDEVITLPVQQRFFNNCWQYVKDGKPDSNFEFLFLLVHLRKHMLNEGVGIRQFMDLAVLVRYNQSLNWNWLSEKLQELKLYRFAETCFAMIDQWFGIKAPLNYKMPDSGFLKQATISILANGVFGFTNLSNKANGIMNEMRAFKGPRWLFRLMRVLEKSFPGYEFLKIGKPYQFLNGRPWLLPVAWVYRFHLMRLGKTTSASHIFGHIMTKNDLIDARETELRQWGLIDE